METFDSWYHPDVLKDRLLHLQNRVFNRPARFLLSRGLAPPTYALLETTGRRTGRARQVPVANGLQGDTFWLIAGLGEDAQYVATFRSTRTCGSRLVQPGCATVYGCAGVPYRVHPAWGRRA